jgi:UDP-N-acetylglucosamine 1-carboxyvinyltransferase
MIQGNWDIMDTIVGQKKAGIQQLNQQLCESKHTLELDEVMLIEQSLELRGQSTAIGAKNAVLVIMASLILTEGKSVLKNVPHSNDVLQMISLLQDLGAQVTFDRDIHQVTIDTTSLNKYTMSASVMKKMRASVLVMGPLLARFARAEIALPGGCLLGARPIDFHLKAFEKMGVMLQRDGDILNGVTYGLKAATIVLEYPSVGATENIMMAASLTKGVTRIINAALEPEVIDLIEVLHKMGARITILPPAMIEIEGVDVLRPIEHSILHDRLEAGALLLAGAVTGGEVYVPHVRADLLNVFLLKLDEMGHSIELDAHNRGIRLKATKNPKAVSFRTAPYPGFPTDLQAPMMVAQCIASGTSVIHETVFENRFLHIRELQKMGAQIKLEGDRAFITGVEALYGTQVIATDIRASCALVLAGLVARGTTVMTGMHHWRRGYDTLEKKLVSLGAHIQLKVTG